jgi:hypothetical protein
MKVLVADDGDQVLAFLMIGCEAGVIMATLWTAMLAGLLFPTLRNAVIAHLTVTEGPGQLPSRVAPRSAP